MKLLQELNAVDLKKSDATDAGSTDVMNKTTKSDIGFSSMRNTINSDGEVTGSDVADYLERAAELNDEVDTVPFGLETDDGDIVKVYVNVEQADKFEEEMKKFLGIEDDIEEAVNKLAQKFDIVDVVWPKNKTGDDDEELVDAMDGENDFDALDDGDEEMEEVARYDELTESHEFDLLEDGDPTVLPTREESNAYLSLARIVMSMRPLNTPGVGAVTGYDHTKFTKLEMIRKYLQAEHGDKVRIARAYIKRTGDTMDYWLE